MKIFGRGSDAPKENSLEIPPAAVGDAKALELVRVWGAKGSQHVSIRVGIWKDPAIWGIMLADLAGHIANAFHESDGLDRAATLNRILEGMRAEVEGPTDTPTGQIIPD